MKGDFSRLTFDRRKHYSGVLMQQGRVLLDADWNEQHRIGSYLMETETTDVVGQSGVPVSSGLNILRSSAAKGLSVLKAAESGTLRGWIVGAKSSIFYWDGKALKAQAPPTGVTATLRSVCFADESHGWAVGEHGTILYTDDGGAEWEKQEAKTENDLFCVYGLKSDKEFLACAVGEKGTLLYSNNSGKAWKKQEAAIKARLNGAHILPMPNKKDYKIFAVGDSRAIVEYVWDIRKNALAFAPTKFGNEANPGQDLYSVNSAVIGNAEFACAVGGGGTIFFKKEGTWNSQVSGVTATLKAILAVRNASTPLGIIPFVLAAVGDDGRVCFSVDGEAWAAFQPALPEKVECVNFIDCNRDGTPSVMTLLGDEGGIFTQTAIGWSRFAGVVTNLSVSAGRIYVDGILCEFDSTEPLPMPEETGKYLLYLDVWPRHITALEDPQIRETALGGPDTCTRLRTVGQLKYLPVISSGQLKEIEDLRASAKEIVQRIGATVFAKSASEDAQALSATTSAMERISLLEDEEIGAHPGVNEAGIKEFINLQKERLSEAALEKVKGSLDAWEKAQAAIVKTLAKTTVEEAWEKLTAKGPCALAASVKQADPQENLCSISAGGGYTGLENQLYRVEIHEGGGEGKATFKWSRDNGSVVFPFEVKSINDNKTIVRLTAQNPGSYYPVCKEEWIGAWVEVLNDDNDLAGEPGILTRVADVPSDAEITLDGSLSTATWSNKAKHPIIRRWDERDAKSGAVAVTGDRWIDLESGVQIRFEKGGTYRTGDYWTIPARSATADVEWPRSNGEPVALPPMGICHHYAKLAVLTAYETGKGKTIVTEFHDCRSLFEPIAHKTLHVTGINWRNDSLVQFDDALYANLLQVGFQIMLDDAPDAWTVNPASLVVTVEMGNGLAIPVRGNIKVQDNIISWRIKAGKRKAAAVADMSMLIDSGVLHNLAGNAVLSETEETAATTVTNYRVRITLKGNLIWRTFCGSRIYLDGRAMGKPRSDRDESGDAVARYDLNFPSGAGGTASDFESWIDLYQIVTQSTPAKPQTPTDKAQGRPAAKKAAKKKR